MNDCRITGLILFILILVFGCTQSKQTETELTEAQKQILTDSIKSLDSLSVKVRHSNHELSLQYARQINKIAHQLHSSEWMVKALKLCGNAHMMTRTDSSFYYYSIGLKLADSGGLQNLKARLLYDLALVYLTTSQFKPALNLIDSAMYIAIPLGDYPVISDLYNCKGNIYFDINEPKEARRMYDSAYMIAMRYNLYRQMGNALGNLARLETDTMLALNMNREALYYLSKQPGTEEEQAGVLINMGYLCTNPDSALSYYNQVIQIARVANMSEIILGVYNNMAYSYMDKRETGSAISCLKDKAIPLAESAGNNNWLATLYDSYAEILNGLGDPRQAYFYAKKSMEAKTFYDQELGANQIRLLTIMLDLKNKDLKIKQTGQELQKSHERVQKLSIWIVASVLLLIVSFLVILFIRMRANLALQKEKLHSAGRIIEIEEAEKGKIAQELHDLTGQLFIGLTGYIENLECMEPSIRHEITVKLKKLVDEYRNIAHRMSRMKVEQYDFSELVAGLCDDMRKRQTLNLQLAMQRDLPGMPGDVKVFAFRIVQELLTNAAKHAKSSLVTLDLTCNDNQLIIIYKDNGPGFNPANAETNGMGIMNIRERSKLLNGFAEVDSTPGFGVHWEIRIPLT